MITADQDSELSFYDYLEIFYRRRWAAAAIAVGVFGALAAYAFLSTPVYQGSSLVEVQRPNDVMADKDSWQPQDDEFLPTQAKLVVSDTAMRHVYDRLGLGSTREFAAGLDALRGAVSVMVVPRTRLLYVNAESSSAQRAADLANAFADEYVRQNLANEVRMSRSVLATVRARSRRADSRAFYESLPVVISNQRVQEIKAQILQAENNLANLRATYTDEHPAVIAAKAQLSQLQTARNAAIAGVVSALMTRLSGQFLANNARVVDVAQRPLHPVRPRRRLALLLGLAAGLLLGGLGAMALDTLDQSVRTHKDVERGLGLQMLGHIPLTRIKRGDRIYSPLVAMDASPSSEAFRSLRTMVLFAKSADPEPALLVTSASQEEGKSFVASNLAVAFAQLGRSVLLIDGDLRRPSLHRIFGAGAEDGLADYLSGRVSDPGQLLMATEVPHLDVLSGGTRPHNPSELLNADQMAELINWARGRYDKVVIDCPPVFPVSDILLWGRHVRSAVLVSRAGQTRMPLIKMACARLRNSGIDILGGVVNGSRPQTMSYAEGHDFHRYCRSLPMSQDRTA